jgi:hypothetical protein
MRAATQHNPADIEAKHQRWQEAVNSGKVSRNDNTWVDPVTKKPYTQGERQDQANEKKYQNMTQFQRETRGEGIVNRVAHDTAVGRWASPGELISGRARIPGTSVHIPGMLMAPHAGFRWLMGKATGEY